MKIFVNNGTVEKVGMGSVNVSTLSWSKIFFPGKVWKHTIFTYEEHMRLYLLKRHKRQEVSFFWIYRFSGKLRYHSYQQRVRKFSFLIRTFVKTICNLMCGSF